MRRQNSVSTPAGARATLHLVDVSAFAPDPLTGLSDELVDFYSRRDVVVRTRDELAVLGVDVSLRADGLVGPATGELLLCRRTGTPLTWTACASRFGRLVIVTARTVEPPLLAGMKAHGVQVVVMHILLAGGFLPPSCVRLRPRARGSSGRCMTTRTRRWIGEA